MELKSFWQSRTFWVNLVAVIASVVVIATGRELSTEVQATIVTVILGVVNLVLRFRTNQAIK